MNSRKIARFLFFAVPIVFVLSIWSHSFVLFLSLALITGFILVIRRAFIGNVFGRTQEPITYYQPTKQPAPPQTTLQPGFHLTPEEYRRLSQQYQQGYQAQTPMPPQRIHEDTQPKQDNPIDYEQPQAHYPEQQPPMTIY